MKMAIRSLLFVVIDPELVNEEDKARLDVLGFFPCEEFQAFKSYKYGSC
jgi:hypothetical protein